MAFDITLPDLGDGIESGDVLEIYVSEGDSVTKDQGLLELETDKATVTVPSPRAGKISKILVKAGQAVPVGSVIVQLEADESTAQPAPAAPPVPTAGQKPTAGVSTSAPSAAESGATLGQSKAASPESQSGSSFAPTVGASSATARSHTSQIPLSTEGTNAPTTSPSASAATEVDFIKSVQNVSPEAIDQDTGDLPVAASPSIRRFAREVGVNLSSVSGSGESGRITREDVLKAVRESSARAASAQASAEAIARGTAGASPPPSATANTDISAKKDEKAVKVLPGNPGQDDFGPVRIDRLSKIRKTIATQMHKSWTVAPQVTNFDDADVTELEAFRISSKDDYAARGIKLTSMPFLIKAVATALRNHPTINATVDLDNDQIVYRDYVNLGVAVDTQRGLVVPNIRNAHLMGIPDIAKSLAEMAVRVREGNFSVNELRGGTFTISNLGAVGGTYSTPILNVPEVAILLVGRTRKLPVVMSDDSIRVRQMMPLSLTYDHRLVDGAAAARFLNEVITLLETPSRLLLAIS